jgi:GAF domain-containing protein/nitrogen-specific signal transduction histidine kinase
LIEFPDTVEEFSRSGDPHAKGAVEAGVRSAIWVAIVKEGVAVGAFVIGRSVIGRFSDKQIALLQNFAAQAVIAMENARLLNEQREALEQQTATAEVLQVINASPGNLQPVFEAILERALRVCEAAFGFITSYDGEHFHTIAGRDLPPAFAEILRTPYRPPQGAPAQRLIDGASFVQIADVLEEKGTVQGLTEVRRALVETAQGRTFLTVALRKEGALLGCIVIYRQEVRPFGDKQISLLENFASQAVIAIENARLLTETREALEQQTATAEVLQVINASPGERAPVFEAMLERAVRLCDATYGHFRTFDGEGFPLAAARGNPNLMKLHREQRHYFQPGPHNPIFGLVRGERLIHIADAAEDAAYRNDPGWHQLVDTGAVRSVLAVALRKENALLGYISVYRQEVRPFSAREIALMQNFAAQAVIAMENARLLTEQREALEQQTATAEVLRVINASPGDLKPVFDAILEKALQLCEASFGILLVRENNGFQTAAQYGVPAQLAEFLSQTPREPGRYTAVWRMLSGEDIVQFEDFTKEPAYEAGDPRQRAFVELGGARTYVAVALRKDGELVGTIAAYRREVRLFTDKQIALLQNFASQAVIAMENARLLDEIRQRQEELRVTFENMGDGVAMFDENQHLVAWNGKFREIFDLPDTLLKQHRTYEEHLRFLAARGDFGTGVDTADQIHELVATTGQPYGYERTRPDGRVIEIRRNPVPDGGFVVIFSDITERKRSEAEVRAARDAAETAYRDLKTAQASLIQAEKMASLGQLTAGIAHEIKNPLNFVNNFADLSGDLLDELNDAVAGNQQTEINELTATLKGNLAKIAEHGKRADGIVRSMLEHSRGSSGERRSVDLNALVDEALNLAYHGARAQDQSFNVTLQRVLAAGMAPITLTPQDITRVLLNLFSNGFYAARNRQQIEERFGFEPTLRVVTRELGDGVEIRVRDNGIGIPVEIRDKLFQPFFTTKPTGEGTGLGLSISYDVVTQQHGGSISVNSKVGEYSEFTIRLPRNP